MKKGKRQMTHVVKDNALINASYNLELVEQRIVLQAIVKARETETGFDTKTPVFIHASEYEKQYNVTKDGAYKALKDAVLSLFERQFSYQEINERGNTENVRSRWVSEVRYVDAEATVKLIFSPAVASMCSRLERHFTSYDLDQIAGLSSKYAVRLYELVIAWKATGKTPVFKLQDFRDKIGLLDENEYSTMSNFKKFVLDLAVDQINEHTDIKLTYEQHKTGRTITGFSFKFKQKVKQQKIEQQQQQRDQNTADLFTKMTDAQRHLFGHKLAHDARVQSEYSQMIGTGSYEDFARLLADMLAEEKHFKMFHPLLVEHGFK
jgi:plasmid replication initiation protein